MRYVFGFLCVCALGLVPLVGCFEFGGFENPCAGDPCDDGNDCTGDGCSHMGGSAICSRTPRADGTRCSLDDQAGVCMHGVCCEALCEDDGNVCTTDCNPVTGRCDYLPVQDGTNCDNGNECITDDTCSDGECADGAALADGTRCYLDDQAGVCIDGVCWEDLCADVTCVDRHPCTEGWCEEGVCYFDPVSRDGLYCYGPDGLWYCSGGVCLPACDAAYEEVYRCPIEYHERYFCCPGYDWCRLECV